MLRRTDLSSRSPSALILEPARELAEQTHVCMETFSKYMQQPQLTNGLFVGGVNPRDQTDVRMNAVYHRTDSLLVTAKRMRYCNWNTWACHGCEIYISMILTTVIDLIESGKMNLRDVRFFVLDEADRLLDTGNEEIIMKIFNQIPKSDRRLQV